MDGLFQQFDEAAGDHEDTPVARLKSACVVERCAPELMQYEQSLVAEVGRMLLASELDDTGDALDEETRRLVAHIREAERERVRFLLALYHRARIAKIERLAARIAAADGGGENDGLRARLSPAEIAFAEDCAALEGDHLRAAFLEKLPEDDRLRALPPPAKAAAQVKEDDEDGEDGDAFVFALVVETVGPFEFSADGNSGATVDLREGDTIVIRWKTVRPLVLQQKAILI